MSDALIFLIMLYRICDCIVDINARLDKTKDYLSDYVVDSGNSECSIELTKEEIISYATENKVSYFASEVTLLLEKFSNFAFNKGIVLFHCSAIEIGGQAILFSAPSGTGKSTHSALWVKNFSDVSYVNDDKPFIKFDGNNCIIYGSPWRGKHMRGENKKCVVKAICFIERAKTNSIKKVNSVSAIGKLINQSYGKENERDFLKLLNFYNQILQKVDVYSLAVNMEDGASILARKTILGDL